MLKRTIKYEDYNGNPAEDDFYFNLTEAELIEMESTYDRGYAETMQFIVDTNDFKTLLAEFKKLVLFAYGEKSPDGKTFVKSEEIARAFSQHAAYSVLFMELATDADKAAEFMNGIIPSRLVEQTKTQDKPTGPPPAPLTSPPQSTPSV